MLALPVLNFCREKWLEDAVLQYSAQVRQTQEYIQYSLVLIEKSEYLNTVLEQSSLLTRWHQKECTHMNKTCTAIENITNDAPSRIVKIQTRNSYSLKIKKTLHTWGIFNSRYLMFTRRQDRREDIKTYSSVRDSDVKSFIHSFSVEKKYS